MQAVTSMFNKSPILQIKFDSAYIIFHGLPDTTGSQILRGRILISSQSSYTIKQIDLEFKGVSTTRHKVTADERAAGYQGRADEILTYTHDPKAIRNLQLKDRTGAILTKILPGDHEYPFEFDLCGDLKESVEGVPGDEPNRRYHVTAHAVMGTMSRDLRAKGRIRIVRTLDGSVEMDRYSSSQDIFGTWTDKLKYSIQTASHAYAFGSKLKVNFELTPLAEKLSFTKVGFSISELESVRTQPGPVDWPIMGTAFWYRNRDDLCKEARSVPEVPDEIDPELQLPMKKFSIAFTLPVSLKQCRHTNDSDQWIRFTHTVHYRILIKNPDGHLSELKARHPIYLYISPRLPINSDDHVDLQTRSRLPTLDLIEDQMAAPPLYQEHRQDPYVDPFSGIVTGANTPGLHSGANTPGRIFNSGLQPMLPLVEDLTSRLAVVERTQTEAAREAARDGFETGIHVEHVQNSTFNMEALSRVPSYDTATHAPCPGPVSEATPTYERQG